MSLSPSKLQAIQARIKQWRDDPVRFCVDELHLEPDNWQAEALRVFPCQDKDKLRISLQACAGPGKTLVLAVMGWNFLCCYGEVGEHPKGAAISITADNLKMNLWPEFAKLQGRSEFLKTKFTWTKERIYANDHPATWFLEARSFSKDANAEEQGRTLSGLHAKFVLFLIDESGDIPPPVLNSAEQALSNCRWGKIAQAGNPTSKDGILHQATTAMRHLWYVIRITGDPDDPKRSTRINIDWAKEQIKLHGRDNPWVMAYILGEFPPGSIRTLLSSDEVDVAMGRIYLPKDYEFAQKRIGIDVAREGLDATVIAPRQGLKCHKLIEMRTQRGNDIAARVAQARQNWSWELCMVDNSGGFGGSVIDSMLQGNLNPIAINFGGKAIDLQYFNKRSEMWFEMAKWVKRGGSLPNDPQLKRELTTPTYSFRNGRFQLEEKDQIKKRLGFSPDRSDALCLTFAFPDMPGGMARNLTPAEQTAMRQGKALSEYNPLQEEEKYGMNRAESDYDPREIVGTEI